MRVVNRKGEHRPGELPAASQAEREGGTVTEALPSTWDSRDLPVLREAVRMLDAGAFPGASVREVAEAASLDTDTARTAVKALAGDSLVEVRYDVGSMADVGHIVGVSGEARRIVGTWPTPANALDRMVAALEHLAEHGETPDDRTRARKILDGLVGASAQVGIGVTTAIITGQVPH